MYNPFRIFDKKKEADSTTNQSVQQSSNQASNSDTNYSGGTTSGLNLAGPSVFERNAQASTQGSFNDLFSMLANGPGANDVTASTDASRGLAALLAQYQQSGGLPQQADVNAANSLADQLFASQRTALNQAFDVQQQRANQQAALMGRSVNDPILRAKLAQQQTLQSAQLAADQGSWAAQFAQNLPMQRLGFAQQRASVLGGLATQAMANRQALASLGSGILGQERAFRVQTAQQFSNNFGNQNTNASAYNQSNTQGISSTKGTATDVGNWGDAYAFQNQLGKDTLSMAGGFAGM